MPRMTKAQREAEARWNNAVDWLLNSRYCGDPDIQAAFWGLVDGRIDAEEADGGYTHDGVSLVEAQQTWSQS